MTLPANEFLNESSGITEDIGDTVVYNAGFTFRLNGPSKVHNHISVEAKSSIPQSGSSVLKRGVDRFLHRKDRVFDRFNNVQSCLGKGLFGTGLSQCPASVVLKAQMHLHSLVKSDESFIHTGKDQKTVSSLPSSSSEGNYIRSVTAGATSLSNEVKEDKVDGSLLTCLSMGNAEIAKTTETNFHLPEEVDVKQQKKHNVQQPPTVTVALSLQSTVCTNSLSSMEAQLSVRKLNKTSMRKYPPLTPSGIAANINSCNDAPCTRIESSNAITADNLIKKCSPKTVKVRADSPLPGRTAFLPVKVNKNELKPLLKPEDISSRSESDTNHTIENTVNDMQKNDEKSTIVVNGTLPPIGSKSPAKIKESGTTKKARKSLTKKDSLIDDSDLRRASLSSDSEDRTSRASSVASNTSMSSETSAKLGSKRVNKLSSLTNKFESDTNGAKSQAFRKRPLRLPISKISDLTSKFSSDGATKSIRKFSVKKSSGNIYSKPPSLDANDCSVAKMKDNIRGINLSKFEPVVPSSDVSCTKDNDVCGNLVNEKFNSQEITIQNGEINSSSNSSLSNSTQTAISNDLSELGENEDMKPLNKDDCVIHKNPMADDEIIITGEAKDIMRKKKTIANTPKSASIATNLNSINLPRSSPFGNVTAQENVVNGPVDSKLKEGLNKELNHSHMSNGYTDTKPKSNNIVSTTGNGINSELEVLTNGKAELEEVNQCDMPIKQLTTVNFIGKCENNNYETLEILKTDESLSVTEANDEQNVEKYSTCKLIHSNSSSHMKTLVSPLNVMTQPSIEKEEPLRQLNILENSAVAENLEISTRSLNSLPEISINKKNDCVEAIATITKRSMVSPSIIITTDDPTTLDVDDSKAHRIMDALNLTSETIRCSQSSGLKNKFNHVALSEDGINAVGESCDSLKPKTHSGIAENSMAIGGNVSVKDCSNLESIDTTSVRNIIDILDSQRNFRFPSHLRESAELIVAKVQNRQRCKSLPHSVLTVPTPTIRSKYISRTRPIRRPDPSMSFIIPSLTEFLDNAEQRLARAIRSPLPTERTESTDTDDDVFVDTLDHLDSLPEDADSMDHDRFSSCSTPVGVCSDSPTPNRVVEETGLMLSETDILLRKSRSQNSLRRSFSRSMSIANMNKLAEVTADLQEQHNTSHLASERMEAEQCERMKLEKEVSQLQEDIHHMTNANDKLEMERLTLRSEMLHQQELNGDAEESDSTIYKRKYEWGVRELELLKKQTKQQEEDAFDQLIVLKKQLEKKAQDSHEEAESQRHMVGQLKKKSQRLQTEMNDLKMLLEEQNSRNNLLEKKQRKFDQEMNLLQDELRKEKLSKDKLQREKDHILAEKYSLEQEFSTMKLETDLKAEKISALKSELEDIHYSGKGEEETAMLKKAKHDLEKKVKEQEEELDDFAGQVQILESAKIRLEMSIEQTRKENRMESQQREDEVEDIRMAAHKKIKTMENQLESDYEERTQLLREKHDLERRLADAHENTLSNADEEYIHKLKKELKKTKALLKDTQTMLDNTHTEGSNKIILRQLKIQLEDAEFAKTVALKARQSAEADSSELQIQLDEAYRAKKDVEDRCLRVTKEKADIHMQLEENEEEVSELMKKYKAAVSQLSIDQITMADQTQQMSELEHEKQILQEKLLELSSKVEVLEGETANIHTQRRLQMKIKELESKLELEHTTKNRLDGQIGRLKDQQERLNAELDAIRAKESKASDDSKKFSRLLRESKEDLISVQQKNTDVFNRKLEIEKQLELSESEVATLKSDLKLAFKRIEDLQQALQGDISDSDSDILDSGSDSESSLSSYLTASMRYQRTSSNSTLRTPPSEILAESKDEVARTSSARSMSAISEDLEESNYSESFA